MKSYFVKRLLDMIYAKNRIKKVAKWDIICKRHRDAKLLYNYINVI